MMFLKSIKRKFRYSQKRSFLALFLILLVCFMGIGYSSLTANLVVNGSSGISNNVTWDVRFGSPNVVSGSVSTTEPTVTDYTTLNFGVTLENPGDFYEFMVPVENLGSVDAMISGVTVSPELTEDQQKYLSCSISYADGKAITANQKLVANGGRETIKVKFEYLANENIVYPETTDSLNMQLIVTYVQANDNAYVVEHLEDLPVNDIVLTVGEQDTISLGEASSSEFTFTSQDEDIAFVDEDGRVMGVTVGSTTITIQNKMSGYSKTIEVTVNASTPKYVVTLVANGGDVNPTTIDVTPGDAIGEIPTPIRTGYYLDNWYTNLHNGTVVDSNYQPDGNIPIYAMWKTSVAQLAISNSSIEVGVGEEETIQITNTVEEEYTFASEDSSIATVDANGKVTGVADGNTNIIITGSSSHQTKTIPVAVSIPVTEYIITLDPNEGSVDPTSLEVTVGEAIEGLPTPSKDSQLFGGWFTAATGGSEVQDGYVPEGDMTLVARWFNTDIVAVVNGETGYTTMREALLSAPTNDTLTNIKLIQDDNSDVEVITQMHAIIVLDLNHFTATNTGNAVIKSASNMTIKNGTMICSAGQGAVNNNKHGIMVLDGVEVQSIGSRQAVYNKGGTLTIKGGSRLTTTKKAGRATLQNLDDSSGGTLSHGITYVLDATVISPNHYALNIESGTVIIGQKNDGIVSTETPYFQGDTYGIGGAGSLEFYDGIAKGISGAIESTVTISDQEDYYVPTDGEDEVIGTNTYHTKYLGKTQYLIEFVANGGTVTPESKKIIMGTEIGDIPTPDERNLYDFLGWFRGIETGEEITSTYIPDGDMKIYARWQKKPVYSVTVEENGGTECADYEYPQGGFLGRLPESTKEGYSIEGWYLEPTFETKVDEYYEPTGNIILYANWTDSQFLTVWEQRGICVFDKDSTITGNECKRYLDQKYIDTGIKLYSEENIEKDYEIHFEIESYAPKSSDNQGTFFNTKYEESSLGYPGLVVRRKSQQTQTELASRTTSSANTELLFEHASVHTFSVYRIDGEIYYSLNGGDLTFVNNLREYNPTFDLAVWFGAAPTNGAATGSRRYITGELKNMYIKLGTFEGDGRYRIRLMPNGGNDLDMSYVFVPMGDAVDNRLPVPTREGYYSIGWFTGIEQGEEVDEDYIPDSDMPVYARWRKSVRSLVLIPENITVAQEATKKIHVINSNAIDETYSFVSADDTIATVDQNGVVTGRGAGTTTISIVGDTSHQTKDVTVTVN